MITKNNEKKCCGIEFYPPQKKKQKKEPFQIPSFCRGSGIRTPEQSKQKTIT